jgi:fido (protein-threonine AMPylation protein)
MYEKLANLKSRLEAFRPFTEEQQSRLDAVLLPRRIQYTNAFGVNTLTLEETRYFLETQRMIGGKLEREFDQIKGVLGAIIYLRPILASAQELDEEIISKLHATLTEPINQHDHYLPGKYRPRDLPILGQAGSRIDFTPPEQIAQEVAGLLNWYHNEGQNLHPLERAARFHYRFSLIHPFMEANGRMARLLDDFILEKGGFGPALAESRERYFNAMRAADLSQPHGQRLPSNGNVDLGQFITVVGEACAVGMQLMLDVLENRLAADSTDLETRLEIFDRVLAGDVAGESDRRLQEEKETAKLAISREVGEFLKDKVRSKVVQFALAGPAKFQHNNHQFSPLIAEVTARHKAAFSPWEVLYEYHLGPDLDAVEQRGLPVKPFMKLLGIAILSFNHTVGIFSGVLDFDFGRVYIKQINRNELILKLQPESVRELTGKSNYQDWDLKELRKFIFNSLDSYFHQIEEGFLKATGNQPRN